MGPASVRFENSFRLVASFQHLLLIVRSSAAIFSPARFVATLHQIHSNFRILKLFCLQELFDKSLLVY